MIVIGVIIMQPEQAYLILIRNDGRAVRGVEDSNLSFF